MKPKDIKKVAQQFHELTLYKYKLAIISNNEEYIFDLRHDPEEGIDELLQRTLSASLNIEDVKMLPPPPEPKKSSWWDVMEDVNDPCCNRLLWKSTLKISQ